ncbi:hypothetical protein CPBF424_12650 [Xanthomonas euroxanthea]|uniref:Uncharacterized protein n=1 Tax=Xanthomonas euroxanthea TaxID=2259622 RepID=A0AA46H9S4_9XANT|nr:hypothetical protein CPBF424_12650 [Xanthomonas euroxanthea]
MTRQLRWRRSPQASTRAERIACQSAVALLGAWCRVRGRDRVAAWMPPPSLHGRTCGVSRHRMRRRAADQLRIPTNPAHEVCRCSVEAWVCCGRLPAYRRGTRRKYVHVGSGAASMPLKVPHRYARKHHQLLSVAETKAKGSLRCTSSRASPFLTTYQQLARQSRMPNPQSRRQRRPHQQPLRDEPDRRPTARNAPLRPDAGAGPDRRPRPGAASTSGAPTARLWPAGRDAVPAAPPLPAAPR